ncbi:hypothetical protein N9085_03060 [Akkermansiaceae bacterium]|nr:hypothetical protein [Akkermansiaceae bacterium]MDB4412245.1 hypothetical protein [Akkermansiaceae bacterium]MDB4562971.1 hypothetical protein [Akkermansiaceae bacterium]MDB4585791.1 hypothetical protein [Akkermansiaceae bacterium]
MKSIFLFLIIISGAHAGIIAEWSPTREGMNAKKLTHLDEAQEIFGLENQINAILALGCNCASIDRLGEIRAEILAILPDLQRVFRANPVSLTMNRESGAAMNALSGFSFTCLRTCGSASAS